MQQNLVSGVRGLDPKQAGGEIKDHDKMTPTYCLFAAETHHPVAAAAAAVTTYRICAIKGSSLVVAAGIEIGLFWCAFENFVYPSVVGIEDIK